MLSAQPLSSPLEKLNCLELVAFSHTVAKYPAQATKRGRFILAHSSEDHSPLGQRGQSGMAPSMLVGAGGFYSYIMADQDRAQTIDKYNLQAPPTETHFL